MQMPVTDLDFLPPGIANRGDEDISTEMQRIADRYQAEEALLAAVASGNEEKAIRCYTAYGELMRQAEQKGIPTSSDPIRDFKNSVLITNTLFRKAIEGNYVHPIYIHAFSSSFGTSIEQAQTMDELVEIIRKMVHVYCRIVREFSTASYSPLIRKALLYIDLNLGDACSTKEIAASLFLTPNYLSTCFTRQVGMSISEYILRRRLSLAQHLLTTTNMSVQEIAAKTGMYDASYFSRQFRRIVGMSPLKFRKTNALKS